jgi:DNA-binding phage protein
MKKTSSDYDQAALAGRIKEMVDHLGTQVEAARIAGISTRQLRTYMSGESNPTFIVIARLTKASGFNSHYVMTGEGQKAQMKAPEATIALPGNIGAYLELRRSVFNRLNDLYATTAWPLTGSEEEELMLADHLSLIVTLPAAHWGEGVEVLLDGHKGAVTRVRRARAQKRSR